MSATSAPFGFIPVRHPLGECRARKYAIASGYGTAMYKYQPVILNTNGTITVGTAAADIIGVLAGVEYTDANGKRVVDTKWPASTTGTDIVAWVWDDPLVEYEVQADGAVAVTAIGDQADVTNVGNNGAGLSQATLSASLAGAGAQAQFRITAIAPDIDNAAGDAYTKVYCTIARHQFVSNKVGI